jgi:predicted dehydrogenase
MLTIGVVGCGYWGPNLIRNFSSLPDCRIRVACDADASRLQHMKTLFPYIETASNFEDVARDPDVHAVAIATPVCSHYPMAKACLENGKHVFIEKPMAASTGDCSELIRAAEERGLRIMVGHTFLFSPPVRKIKEIIDRGALGEILYVSARRLNLGLFQKDINVMWDLAPHDLSIILYLLGQVPISVNCLGQAHLYSGIEDVTVMTLNFGKGKLAIIQNSWLDPNKVRDMTIVGSRRMLVYNDLEPNEKIKIFDKRVEAPPYYDTFAEFHYSYHYGDIYSPYLKMHEPLKLECQNFIDSISGNATCESDGYNGMQVVRILEGASQSLKAGGTPVKLETLQSVQPKQPERVAA